MTSSAYDVLLQQEKVIVANTVTPNDGDTLQNWSGMAGAEVVNKRFGLLTSLSIQLGGKKQEMRLVPEDDLKDCPIRTTRVILADGDSLKGFQCRVVLDSITGGEYYYDCSAVIVRDDANIRIEPLSGALVLGANFPGMLKCLPDVLNLDQVRRAPDVHQLHILSGKARDHITHVGPKPIMFWVEIMGFSFFMYYFDVGLDIKQVFVFANAGLHTYLAANAIGMSIAALTSICDVYSFLCDPSQKSAEKDALMKHMNLPIAVVLGIMLVLTQTHILFLTWVSCYYRKKHPLLSSFKLAEFVEAALSALVQLDCISCFICKINGVVSVIGDSIIHTLGLSIASSCCSLGLSLASRDKTDTKVCGLQGRLEGWPVEFFALIAVRTLEATSRFLSVVLIHLGTRGSAFKYTLGISAVCYILLTWILFSRYATVSDAFTALIAHPGQILEKTSVFPLHRSLVLHSLLALAAGAAQYLAWCSSKSSLRMDAGPSWLEWILQSYRQHYSDSKAVPDILLGLWLVSTLGSIMGLLFFNVRARRLPHHPTLSKVKVEHGKDTCIDLSKLPSFSGLFPVSPGVWRALSSSGMDILVKSSATDMIKQLDKDLRAEGIQCPVRLSLPSATAEQVQPVKFLDPGWCSLKSVNADGCSEPRELVHAVKKSQDAIEELSFRDCKDLKSFEECGGCQFPNVKKADFTGCFQESGAGAEQALGAVSASKVLEDVSFGGFGNKIPQEAWKRWQGCNFPNLKKAAFEDCFADSGAGAEHALGAVSTSKVLEDVNLYCCKKIPEEAWKRWQGCNFPNLKKANFAMCFSESGAGAEYALESVSASKLIEYVHLGGGAKIQEAWKRWQGSTFPNLKEAILFGCFAESGAGAEHALRAVRTSKVLEVVNLDDCKRIPEEAWKLWQGSTFPSLKTAHFERCFGLSGAGAEHALGAACTSKVLEFAFFDGCKQISDEAWKCWQGRGCPVGDSVPEWVKEKCLAQDEQAAPHQEHARDEGGSAMLPVSYLGEAVDIMVAKSDSPPFLGGAKACPRILPNLKEVNFGDCSGLYDSGAAAEQVLHAVSTSKVLERTNFQRNPGSGNIPEEAWKHWQGCNFPNLKTANFSQCFSQSGAGAEHALGAVGTSKVLEDMDFSCCPSIPENAWKRWQGCTFPNLKKSSFRYSFTTLGVGSEHALGAVGSSKLLEDVNFDMCEHVPEEAWKRWQGCTFPNLKKASFAQCFFESGAGAEHVLGAVSTSKVLEDVNFTLDMKIHEEAWKRWQGCTFPNLKRASFLHSFKESGAGAEHALGAVSTSKLLEHVDFEGGWKIPEEAWKRWQSRFCPYGAPEWVQERCRNAEDEQAAPGNEHAAGFS